MTHLFAPAGRLSTLGVLAALSLWAAGCSDSGGATCGVPGATQACLCPGSISGAQSCQADGSWDACECTPDPCADGACDDDDGDGLDAAAEAAAGTDPDKPDTDGDGLNDGVELLGPDLVADTGDEVGTDPTAADSDGDGFDDGVEVEAGSDPMDPVVWPFASGEWPDLSDEAAEARVWGDSFAIGEVMPDFIATDQFDNPFNLYDFYGHVIVVRLGAGWCVPCRELSEGSEEFWVDKRGAGLIVMELLIDDHIHGGDIAPGFHTEYADELGLSHPVVAARGTLTQELFDAGLYDGALPLVMFLDRRLRISSVAHAPPGGMAGFSDTVDVLLEADSPL